jgi:hypothetical protein
MASPRQVDKARSGALRSSSACARVEGSRAQEVRMKIPKFQVLAVASLYSFATLGVAGCGDDDDDDDVAVLECSGMCSCNEDTRTCSCAGGTECTLAGEGNVTFTCDGNASCDLLCGDDCNIVCPGTTGCAAESGAGAEFECQGTALCEFTCQADCVVNCTGAAQCLVTCEDEASCNLDNCRASTPCGDGVFACGRACP